MLQVKIDKTYQSPNFNERKDGRAPDMLVLHYTGLESARQALEWLCDPDKGVSAHYVIDEAGAVYQLVADEHRAWHAGVSYWDGESDINAVSIGIELVNPGHEFGYEPFPAVQIEAAQALCQKLMKRYKISPWRVLGHSDVAPERKVDPGHLFPWRDLAREGVGIWPVVSEVDRRWARDASTEAGYKMLLELGYGPDWRQEANWQAFHRRFAPERFSDLFADGKEPDIESLALVSALVRVWRYEKL